MIIDTWTNLETLWNAELDDPDNWQHLVNSPRMLKPYFPPFPSEGQTDDHD